jgi:transposase
MSRLAFHSLHGLTNAQLIERLLRQDAELQALRREHDVLVRQLRQDNAQLRRDLAASNTRNAQLEAQFAAANARISALEAENVSLRLSLGAANKRADSTEKLLADAREQLKKNSNNSHLPPSSDGPAVKPPADKTSKRPAKAKKLKVTKPHMRLLSDKPDSVIEVKPLQCAHCKAALGGEDAHPVRHQVAEIPPQIIHTTEYRVHTLRCTCCGKSSRAELPQQARRGAFGPRLTALCMYLIGAVQLSRRSVQTLLGEWGCHISLGALTKMQHTTTAALAQPYEQVREVVASAPSINADETSWRQKKARRWVWVACCAAATLYKVQDGRNTACAKTLLGEDRTDWVVTTDRLGSYNWIDGARRQLCWAHIKRDFKAIEERTARGAKTLGTALGILTKRMFRYWHRYRAGKKDIDWFKTMLRGEIKPKIKALLTKATVSADAKSAGTCGALLKKLAEHVDVCRPSRGGANE